GTVSRWGRPSAGAIWSFRCSTRRCSSWIASPTWRRTIINSRMATTTTLRTCAERDCACILESGKTPSEDTRVAGWGAMTMARVLSLILIPAIVLVAPSGAQQKADFTQFMVMGEGLAAGFADFQLRE